MDWLLWQLADSAFPTGGFAHSGGLEAAWQHGEVPDGPALAAFIKASLRQAGHSSLPLMTGAYDEPDRLIELDRLCESFTTNHVANRASRLQGRALLASAERIFGAAIVPWARGGAQRIWIQPPADSESGWRRLVAAIPTGPKPVGDEPSPSQRLYPDAPDGADLRPPYGHLAPVFGALAAQLQLGREDAGRLFLFLHLRGLMAGAVRLGVVGPLEAQALQHRLGPEAEEILQRCQNDCAEEIAQTAPLLDLWQGAQDRLYSRLFQS